jgi:hypothetical protein
MRKLTAAIVAVLVVVGATQYVQTRVAPKQPETPRPSSPLPASKSRERSFRVEERFGPLHADLERRQAAPEADKHSVPTVTDERRQAMGPADDADDQADDDDPAEMEQLKRTLLTDPDPDERIGAVIMLTGEEGPESLSMLLEAMGDPDPEVRLAVIEALGDRAEELSPDTLVPALRDSDPEVRYEAVSILGDMEDNPRAQQLIAAAQTDEDQDVRALANTSGAELP